MKIKAAEQLIYAASKTLRGFAFCTQAARRFKRFNHNTASYAGYLFHVHQGNYNKRTSHDWCLNRQKHYKKNKFKKYSMRNVTQMADISISIVSFFACTVVRSLSIVAHSISTAVGFSCGTLVDIWKDSPLIGTSSLQLILKLMHI